MTQTMTPTREAAERISARALTTAQSEGPILGLMCECHYGEDFDVADIDRVLDIMNHTQYDHVTPREMYLVRATQVTW